MAVRIEGPKHTTLSDAEKDGDGNTFIAVIQNPAFEKGLVVYRIASGLTKVNGVQEKAGTVTKVLEPKVGTGDKNVATYLIGINVRRDGWGEVATWNTDQATYEPWALLAPQGWSRKVSDGNLSTGDTSSVDALARQDIAYLRSTVAELKQQLAGLERYSESRDAIYERLEERLAKAGRELGG